MASAFWLRGPNKDGDCISTGDHFLTRDQPHDLSCLFSVFLPLHADAAAALGWEDTSHSKLAKVR